MTICFMHLILRSTVTTIPRHMSPSVKLNAAGHRWVAELADYRFTLKYRPGSTNRDADFLSRRPKPIEEIMRECTEECQQEVIESIGEALEREKKQRIGLIGSLLSPTIQMHYQKGAISQSQFSLLQWKTSELPKTQT